MVQRLSFTSMPGPGQKNQAEAPPLSLIERFSKDDTTPLTTPKRGKNDVEMP